MQTSTSTSAPPIAATGSSAVSIVLVSWNSRHDLRALLPQLLELTDVEHEMLVIDNASTDGTPEEIESRFPSVRLVRNPRNLGFAAGVNVGMQGARNPLILLLNPDSRLRPNAISRLVAHLDAHPTVGIVGPRVLNEDGTLQSAGFRFPSLLNLLLSATYLYKLSPRSRFWNRERLGGTAPASPTSVDAVSGCCLLLRRSLLDQIGLLDEGFFMYAEETDFCYRARRSGWSVHCVPDAEIVHVGGGSSRLARRQNFLEFRRSLLRFFSKHRGRGTAEAARALLLLFLLLRAPYWALRASVPGAARAEAAAQMGNVLAGVRFLLSPLPSLLESQLPTRAGFLES